VNIDFETVWADANARYATKKLKAAGYTDIRYVAPELIPQIQSEQVKCMLEALISEVNRQSKDNILGPKRGGVPF
jgi:hypothetical protein